MASSVKSKHTSEDSRKLEDVEKVDGGHSAFEKKTIRLVDWRMLPLLGMLYAVALIDRTNLGIARTAGMGQDLKLQIGNRYSIVSCLYFVPYIILQLPSNIFLRFIGARTWLAFCVTSWGAVQLAMGFVPTWGFLALCRVLLGVFEAGFFPALVFIITTWYKRHEVQKRLAAFYLISLVLGGFSSIFAYGLTFLMGKGGLAGWAWIFIIEGAITVALGAITFLFVPDFPDRNKFLTPEQTQLVLARVEADRGDSIPDTMSLSKVLQHLGDWTIWAYALMFMCSTMPAYAIGYFITIILFGMGWGLKDALLLSAPPYVFAAVSTFFFAWISDKMKKRAPFIAVQAVITLVGLLITGYAKQNGARYFGLFLADAGSAGCIPGVLAYSANNVVSHSKRAVSTALIVAFGGIGGIFATTAFREHDAPKYIPGIWATIACQFFLLVLLGITSATFLHRNKLGKAGTLTALEGQPGFLYTI